MVDEIPQPILTYCPACQAPVTERHCQPLQWRSCNWTICRNINAHDGKVEVIIDPASGRFKFGGA
jgi:hypothetical protein